MIVLDAQGRKLRRSIGFLWEIVPVIEPTTDIDVSAVSDQSIELEQDDDE